MFFTLLYTEIHAKPGYESLVQNGHFVDEFLTFSYFDGTIYLMQVDELQYEFPTAGVQYMSHRWMIKV